MVSDLLDRLVREFAQELILRFGQPLEQQCCQVEIEQMPSDRLREVAVGLLDQQAVAEIEHVAVEGELVSVARLAEQQGRLANQVEREVGEAEIDLERRRVPAPFAEPLAEDQRVVAEAQQIIEARL